MMLSPNYRPKPINQPGWKRLKITKKQLVWLLASSLTVFVSLVAVWYLFIGQQGNFSSQEVDLKLDLPSEVVNGETFEFTVSWSNNEKVALDQVRLSFMYPVGFAMLGSLDEEETSEKDSWSLPRINSGAGSSKKFQATMLGEPGTSKELSVTLSYQPENFSSTFQTNAKGDLRIGEADLSFEFIAPTSVQNQEGIDIKIKYKNVTNKDLQDLRVQLEYPEGFIFSKSDPVTLAKRKDMFTIASLEAGESGIIDIQGGLSGEAGEEKMFKASLGIVDQFKQFYPQVSQEKSILIVKPEVSLVFTANKEQILNVAPDTAVNFNIKYNNIGNVIIKNAVIEVKFEDKYFDTNSINVEQSGVYSSGKIIWDQVADPELEQLKPGQGGDLRFSLPIANSVAEAFSTIAEVQIYSKDVSDLMLIKYTDSGNDVELRSITGLDLAVEARYYDIELAEVGSGPLPPEVGKETTYMIFLTVVNDLAKLENVRLITKLNPDDKVSYLAEDKTSAGSDLRFNQEDKEIIWEIGNLEKSSDIQTVLASFRVGLTAVAEDIDQVVELLSSTVITAYDPETDKDLSKSLGVVDTELETDFGATDKWKVLAGEEQLIDE